MKHEAINRKWRNLNLQINFWQPEKQAKAWLLIVHGQSDHSARFKHVAQRFINEGCAVAGIDLQGHGKSEGKRGHVANFNDYIEQVNLGVETVKEYSQDAPIVLYGQSMGGLIVLHSALQTELKVEACIASSPWIKLAFDPPAWRMKLGKWLLGIAPGLVQPAKLDVGMLTHVEDVQEAYLNDPLVHSKITPAAFFGLVNAGENLISNSTSFDIPVLILHGTADKITSCNASSEFAERNNNVECVEFQGLYHELHNEMEQEEVFSVQINWLKQKLDL